MPTKPANNQTHDAELEGIDALDLPLHAALPSAVARAWASVWPKLTAALLIVVVWQLLVWFEVKPVWVLPAPLPVFRELFDEPIRLLQAIRTTLTRAGIGYGLAVLVGTAIGLVVSRSRILRAATGSLVTGLQTMPSIAWFPFAILLFGLNETAILFVVVLGAAPSVANGLVSAIDNIPPVLLRAGRILGARRLARYRHIVLPAALPGFLSGMKQGWAFAWRSLMAGELLVIIAEKPSVGVLMKFDQDDSNATGLVGKMIVVLLIGILVDAVFFGRLERAVRTRWGLAGSN